MKISVGLCLVVFLLIQSSAFPQFVITYNHATGAVSGIENPSDAYKMNWIFSSSDSIPTWQKPQQDWGLGKYSVAGKTIRWETPATMSFVHNNSHLLYKTTYLDVAVTRTADGNFFTETYTFRNNTNKALHIDSLQIYTPFNDNYPDAKTCITNRCNTHIWTGINASYVNAIRMGGAAPHFGLVLTKGALQSYSVENRGLDGGGGYKQSNTRGTLLLNAPDIVLQPDATYTLQWKIFWHKNWNDFFAIAKELGFVKLDAKKYVAKQNEIVPVSIVADASAGIKNKTGTLQTNELGEHTFTIHYGNNQQTILNYLVISSSENLIAKRVHFIVDHQQMNNANDLRYGAYMVYDNDGDSILTDSKVSSDKNEGRERVGMGVFIAKWLQTHNDSTVYKSLLRYVSFVRDKLQSPDYSVFSGIVHGRKRGYNYPWVADLYLQTYFLTKDIHYLKDYYYTLLKFYKDFGYQFYAIDIPVQSGIGALRNAGLQSESDTLLQCFIKMGDHFVKNGVAYPKSEVNYEQSIVAPSVLFLSELYQVTKEKKYLDEATAQMPALEVFSGRQPDVHLNEIAIRHWDGYWFGKKEMWGDVMPHYWSMLTAMAYEKYFECTGEQDYKARAKKIAENNLLNFKEDGRASCAYLYPLTIDDKPGKFYDPYANDQDWALYFYLQLR